MSANPYQSPKVVTPQMATATSHRQDSEMSLGRATLYVASTTAGAAAIGCLIGIGIGTFAPEYYRFLFRAGPTSDFHPATVGGSMGLIQGGGVGLGVGILMV